MEFQVAKHPNCSPPRGPSLLSVISILAVGDEVMPHSFSRCWEASFSTPQDQRFIWEGCLWCTHNMKDAGLSARCQLGNYPALLPWVAQPTKPARPSGSQPLCCCWTWLIPRDAGLSPCSSVNDFIQWGEVTRGLVINGEHFTVKRQHASVQLSKKTFKTEEGKK